MPIRTVQQRFTAGEIDPLMKGRSDIEHYYSAAETMLNVFVLPQGGFRRRDGLEYLDRLHRQVTRVAAPTITAPNGGTTANANDDNTATELLTTTNITTTDPYVVVHYDLGSLMDVAYVDIVGGRLTSGTSSEFYVQYSTDNSTWTSTASNVGMSTDDITQRERVRANVRYIRFVRIGSTDLSTAKAAVDEMHVWEEESTLSTSKLMPFEFNNVQSYMMLVTDKNIAVYKGGVWQTDVRAETILEANISELNWTQSADTMIIVQEDTAPLKLTRGSSDLLWTLTAVTFDSVPQYDFTPVTANPAYTLTPSAVSGTITLTTSGAHWSTNDVGQYIEGNGGRAKIVAYQSTTVVDAVTIIPFYNTNAVASGSWEKQSGYEDVWSSTQGYPRSATFHDSRLWFGGSKERPQTVWGSRIGLFFDFNTGAFLDDDAIDVTLDTDQVNAITNIFSQRVLQVFTTGGEFVVEQGSDSTVTPANIAIRRQTQRGSAEFVRPVEVEGGTLFVQRGGKSIVQFIFSDVEQAFSNNEISFLASHLINVPVDMAIRKGTSTQESSYLLVVNTDGSLAVAALFLNQNVIAFTDVSTDGLFKNAGVDVDTMYFTVERTINGVTTRYLERFNSSHYTDASTLVTTGLPTDTFTGLDHLEGEDCRVRADSSVMANQTPSSGSVTIERDAATDFEIGLNFNTTIKTLPVESPKHGALFGRKKRITELSLRLSSTSGLRVNGNVVSFRGFGEGAASPLDVAPPLYTGDKVVESLLGRDDTGQVTITQVDPVPMTVLALSLKVSF